MTQSIEGVQGSDYTVAQLPTQFTEAICYILDYEAFIGYSQTKHYDLYLPALTDYEVGTQKIVFNVEDNLGQLFRLEDCERIKSSVSRGIRAGYAWAKAELANG